MVCAEGVGERASKARSSGFLPLLVPTLPSV
jgi:hypothetical protein